MIQTTKTID